MARSVAVNIVSVLAAGAGVEVADIGFSWRLRRHRKCKVRDGRKYHIWSCSAKRWQGLYPMPQHLGEVMRQ
jgi:hypothetical protein